MYQIFLALLLLSSNAYSTTTRKAEIPEPLNFDLVRRINSEKGEFEFNILSIQTNEGMELSPEVEYAIADGIAVEFELPTHEGTRQSYKFAYQQRILKNFDGLSAFQIISENFHAVSETTGLFLRANSFTETLSFLYMLGVKKISNQDDLNILFNYNLFIDYSKFLDFGLEFNFEQDPRELAYKVIPQIHTLISHDFKIQAGFGIEGVGAKSYPLSVFRFIKEFN